MAIWPKHRHTQDYTNTYIHTHIENIHFTILMLFMTDNLFEKYFNFKYGHFSSTCNNNALVIMFGFVWVCERERGVNSYVFV